MPAPIETGPQITRSQLYALVWAHETEMLAAHLKLSGSLIGRICRRWKISKPGRGHWQQVKAGQRHERPRLIPLDQENSDPIVMHGYAGGYTTVVPKPEGSSRIRGQSAEPLSAYFRSMPQEREQTQKHIFDTLTGPTKRHLFVIEDWKADLHIDTGMQGLRILYEDEASINLSCRYVLPKRRRGLIIQATLQFGFNMLPEEDQEPSRGSVDFASRTLHLQVAEQHASFLCSALASGRIRALDIETSIIAEEVETILRATLCTTTFDEAELP